MTTIRPNLLPQTPQRAPNEDSARLAAQRAFFSAAMGQTQASAASRATAAAPPVAQPAQVNRIDAAASSEAPQKILRPGSLLDIRV